MFYAPEALFFVIKTSKTNFTHDFNWRSQLTVSSRSRSRPWWWTRPTPPSRRCPFHTLPALSVPPGCLPTAQRRTCWFSPVSRYEKDLLSTSSLYEAACFIYQVVIRSFQDRMKNFPDRLKELKNVNHVTEEFVPDDCDEALEDVPLQHWSPKDRPPLGKGLYL